MTKESCKKARMNEPKMQRCLSSNTSDAKDQGWRQESSGDGLDHKEVSKEG